MPKNNHSFYSPSFAAFSPVNAKKAAALLSLFLCYSDQDEQAAETQFLSPRMLCVFFMGNFSFF